MLEKMSLHVQKEARQFVLTTVGACVAIWGVAFELGVWGEVFYNRLFNIWVISLAVFLAIWFLPSGQVSVKWGGKLAIAFPTIWLLLTFLNGQVLQLNSVAWIGFLIGLVVSVLCLPYFTYVLVSLLQPETLSMEPRLIKLMILIVFIVGVAGYVIGNNNKFFMTCHNFEIHGDFVPASCVEPN
jgi:hypothetical protein